MNVSVCMAVYNGAAYLRPQIESILAQLTSDDELIIVDDCSVDESPRILNTFDDPRVKVITQSRNTGPLKAFEAALKATRGEYIFFADQDDIWGLNKVRRTLETFAATNALAIVSDAQVVDASESVLMDSYFEWRKSGSGLLRNYYKNAYVGCCMAIRKECKEFLMPFPRLAFIHDAWIGLACELAGPTYFLPESLLKYRRHAHSYSSMTRYPWPTVIYRRLILLITLMQRLPRIILWRLRHARRG